MKKKPLPKKSVASTKKTNTVGKLESNKVTPKKLKATPKKVKAKSAAKGKPNNHSDSSDSNTDHDSETIDRKPMLEKLKKNDLKEVVGRKRMASLNASAMMAATYEVERHLDKCEEKLYKKSADSDDNITLPKKAKDIKNEVLEPTDVRKRKFYLKLNSYKSLSIQASNYCDSIKILSFQAKPVSTNVVIVQDTDVTITGVYVNSTLGSSQEAYCKMQYRVQSSVTEERLVRPTPQEPPKSYTPLNALSCMLPPSNESGE